jgi:hypothetical protein
MKHFSIIAAAVIATILLLTLLIPSGRAQSSDSQEYHPSRYVIVAAPINVLSPGMGAGHDTQYVMVKMDTVTGKTWILQLDVAGGNNPKVRASSWHELGSRH